MNLIRRKGQVVYEDLLRELELVEHQVMQENSALAMSIMVLEAKLRDRFHQMDQQIQLGTSFDSSDDFLMRDNMSVAELECLIPRDLPAFPDAPAMKFGEPNRTLQTVGLAALLAMATACGVFGLATALQLMLGWLA